MKELNRKRPFSYLGPVTELGEASSPEKDNLPGKRKPDRLNISAGSLVGFKSGGAPKAKIILSAK